MSRAVQGNCDIWLLDGTRMSRITFDAARDELPLWSPDGTGIVFRSIRTGSGDLYYKRMSGGDAPEPLVVSEQFKAPSSWSADGRFLLYASIDPQTGADLWVLPMEGDRTPWVFLKTPFREVGGVFSPDGRWVAYHSNESGRPEVYVRPFVPPGATGTSADGGSGRTAGVHGGRHLSRMAAGRPGAVLPQSGRRDDGGNDQRYRGHAQAGPA